MSSTYSPSTTKSAFEWLPVEIRHAVMKELPDLLSLDAMIRSCSAFKETFAQARSMITTHVLSQQLGPYLLPEAVAVLESSRNDTWNQGAFSTFVGRYLHDRSDCQPSWRPEDIKSVAKLHRRINYFAVDFAAKSKSRVLGESASPTIPERGRFQRAFYRFELFCNIFRDFRRPALPMLETRTQFFARFSTVENEQLACVRDYLFRAIAPAFDHMVEHDVVWGEMFVEYSDWRDPGYIEPLLARGIEGIYSIATAEGYEDIYNSMYPRYPETTQNFLDDALKGINEGNDGVPFGDYTLPNQINIDSHSFFEETDEGPAVVWRWAHQSYSRQFFVHSDDHKSLREWGYVMWDLSELNKGEVGKVAWQRPAPESPSMERHSRESRQSESISRRAEIYQKGGRGWWSFEDESKVVWPSRKAPPKRPLPNGDTNINSLENAKNFLRSLR